MEIHFMDIKIYNEKRIENLQFLFPALTSLEIKENKSLFEKIKNINF